MRQIDLVVVRSVAVNAKGAPAGQETGYSDIELGLLTEAGLATERTTICVTVHELQVLDEELPESGHDFRVDFIATPQRIVWSSEPPRGFRRLSPAQIAAIPALKARAD
jgi:5-formyltetrahydrofolate cyclo-ligase